MHRHRITMVLKDRKLLDRFRAAPFRTTATLEVRMRSFRRLVPIALVLASALAGSSPVRAQVITATLYGVVHDSTGAILPGATVVVTHQGTNLTRETVSDERGEFALPALPPGPYAIKIELSGFKTYTSQ